MYLFTGQVYSIVMVLVTFLEPINTAISTLKQKLSGYKNVDYLTVLTYCKLQTFRP